jgi:hypothetical protein
MKLMRKQVFSPKTLKKLKLGIRSSLKGQCLEKKYYLEHLHKWGGSATNSLSAFFCVIFLFLSL